MIICTTKFVIIYFNYIPLCAIPTVTINMFAAGAKVSLPVSFIGDCMYSFRVHFKYDSLIVQLTKIYNRHSTDFDFTLA